MSETETEQEQRPGVVRLANKVGEWWLWANETDFRTWIVHAVIAVVIALVTSPAVAVGFYTIREIEQIVNKLAKHQEIDWLDAIMDVLAPALVVGLLVWLGLDWYG